MAEDLSDLGELEKAERKLYSQNGEDGVIEAIFRAIGTTNRCFVEIGCGDGTECNTASLLDLGWKGVLFDKGGLCRNSLAHIVKAHVTSENVMTLLREVQVPAKFDLLSIDIDGNDYWVWKSISLRPRVVVIEYNAHIPPQERRIIEYDPSFCWNGSDYFGASLKALTELGEEKQYSLVYCETTGNNAFFIANEGLPSNFRVRPIGKVYRPPNYFGNGGRHPHDSQRIMIDPCRDPGI